MNFLFIYIFKMYERKNSSRKFKIKWVHMGHLWYILTYDLRFLVQKRQNKSKTYILNYYQTQNVARLFEFEAYIYDITFF